MLIKFFVSAANNGYLNGLANEFNESTNSIRKELNNLSSAGYLLKSKENNRVIYNANTSHPMFEVLQKIVRQHLGLEDIVETVIERIGPNIQRLFFQNNINSWESLSKCSVQKCQSILDAAGEAYKMHSPKGWPDQARMAHRGQWERLRKWKKQTLS